MSNIYIPCKMNFNNKGQVNIPLLALFAVIGIIAYLLITQSFNFKNPILGSLYNKTPSQAFDGVEIPPQDGTKTLTSNWSENWDVSPYLSKWNQINFNCSAAPQEKNLNLNCTSGTLLSKTNLKKDSSIIVTGSLQSGNNSSSSVGLQSSGKEVAKITTGSPSVYDFQIPNYQPGTPQNFKLVYSNINNERFVFYYLRDSPEPFKTGPISVEEDLTVSLSCQGLCTFGPLTLSAVPAE